VKLNNRNKAVALLSGGLDSHLAIKIIQMQGIEVEALNFKSTFSCCKDDAGATARSLGVKLTLLSLGEDYLKLIRKPRFGWGRGVNPCVDCRVYMFDIARKFMEQVGASFIISGEVLGQRPKSQMRDQLKTIQKESDLDDVLLRPLSAKLLPPTLPERMGIVDRSKLYDIEGRSRQRLHELARELGIEDIPQPSIGCILTDENYGERVKDHLSHSKTETFWEYESFKIGRHYRLDDDHKAIVGRKQIENETLEHLHKEEPEKTTFFKPENFIAGPSALLVGTFEEELLPKIGNLILQYSKKGDLEQPRIQYRNASRTGVFLAEANGEELVKI
jgi:tRNA-uridine 2-sulfurtransferase